MAKKKPHLRIIGDIHDRFTEYIELTKGAKFSIQVGDLGQHYQAMERVNPVFHRVILGNHDDYAHIVRDNLSFDDKYVNSPSQPYSIVGGRIVEFINFPEHNLGHYGIYKVPETDKKIFFLRGSDSIDAHRRTIGIDYWYEEELTRNEFEKAFELYETEKPEFVITHTCPLDITHNLNLPFSGGKVFKSKTNQALQKMFDFHQPKIWIFGHFHQDWMGTIEGTNFICLDILSKVDFDNKFNML